MTAISLNEPQETIIRERSGAGCPTVFQCAKNLSVENGKEVTRTLLAEPVPGTCCDVTFSLRDRWQLQAKSVGGASGEVVYGVSHLKPGDTAQLQANTSINCPNPCRLERSMIPLHQKVFI